MTKAKDYQQLVDTLKLLSDDLRRAESVCYSIMASIGASDYPDLEYLAKLKGEAEAYEVAATKIDAAIHG